MTALRLVVTEGAAAGRWASLEPGAQLVIGRAADADLCLPDPRVAPRQLEVTYALRGPRVRDLAGGALLNGAPLTASAPLADADVLTLGATRLTCVRGAARPSLPRVPGIELLAPLGSGAAGTVYQGLRDGHAVAVKVLADPADRIEAQRLAREARLSARLRHPALPAVHELVQTADGAPALIRELVAGESLAERVARDGPLPWTAAVQLGATLADALAHAHAHDVIHRDVKPLNVILGPHGPWLIDLGLGRVLDSAERTRLTASREGLGTLLYMAPEQLADARRVDGRADVYGLALTLYHALRGEPPFMDVEPEDFLAALNQRGPTPLGDGVPRALRAILSRAYATDPAARPEARHLAGALRQLVRLA